MKIAVIFNPAAGSGFVYLKRKKLKAALKYLQFEWELFETKHSNDEDEILNNLDFNEYSVIAVAGGDGTNFNIINALIKSDPTKFNNSIPPTLAVLPTGTGNSFSRDLNIFSLDDSVKAINSNNTRACDIGVMSQPGSDSYYFINTLGVGLVSNIAKRAIKFKFLGAFSFVIGTLIQLVGLRTHKIELTMNKVKTSNQHLFVEICNSRFTGGNMLMAPNASIDNGMLEVISVKSMSRLKLLSIFHKIFDGSHIEETAVKVNRSNKIEIESEAHLQLLLDGEIQGTTPCSVTVSPYRLKYIDYS